jgi:hypothetical protein
MCRGQFHGFRVQGLGFHEFRPELTNFCVGQARLMVFSLTGTISLERTADAVAPTELPSDKWVSGLGFRV